MRLQKKTKQKQIERKTSFQACVCVRVWMRIYVTANRSETILISSWDICKMGHCSVRAGEGALQVQLVVHSSLPGRLHPGGGLEGGRSCRKRVSAFVYFALESRFLPILTSQPNPSSVCRTWRPLAGIPRCTPCRRGHEPIHLGPKWRRAGADRFPGRYRDGVGEIRHYTCEFDE